MAQSIGIDEAARLLATAKRIMVLGCSGSGKSTLSRNLAARLGLDYVSIDRDVLWLPGWTLRPKDEVAERVAAFSRGERWVFDGTGPEFMRPRLERAEMVIWLRPPRMVSINGILRRWVRFMGRARPEMADGCPEKMDLEFLQYVWNFERDQVPRIDAQLALYGAGLPVLMLKSYRETNALLALLGQHS